MTSDVRVRFAPSPTGYLHVGGARTALFNYLFARHHKGTFILRIEDTDQKRIHEEALTEIFTSLKWLGLPWDEGPECGGEYGPYFQSERKIRYQEMVDRLVETGHAYRCYCDAERLQTLRETQQKEKKSTIMGYDGHCRNVTEEERKIRESANLPFVIRLKIPSHREILFQDAIRGEITYSSDVLDDLVLLKSDGFPTYHLANVVDDHDMKISHVLRGDEWITSTPKHVLLYEAFQWKPPVFAHLPVILSASGGKLSKRKGAASVQDYQQQGFLPEALFNFLSLLGWSAGEDREKMSVEQIISLFSLDRVSPKSSVFDEKKLDWMNGLYLQERSVESIQNTIIPQWKEEGCWKKDDVFTDQYCCKVIELLKDRSKRLNDIVTNGRYFFCDPDTYEEKAVKKHWKGDALSVLQKLASLMSTCDSFEPKPLENLFQAYCDESGLSGGKLIHPTRLAVSGVSFGPGLFELLTVLGKKVVLRRMSAAISWIQNRTSEQ